LAALNNEIKEKLKMPSEQISNNSLAKFLTVEWLSLMGGLLMIASVSGMGYSNLLAADDANIKAIKANTKAMQVRDEDSKAFAGTQAEFTIEIQTIHLRLQAIEINQENSTKQQDRIEDMLERLIQRS
tara:strand:- start:1240 stop:1623 length:384 start_codon:yes stop_codon:yes gene_type:complete